ncbi:MAG: L-histidine N(alpha)-methyltransferase [Candidatus Competibacterales bacterium]
MTDPALEAARQRFLSDVWTGLSQTPKRLDCKYFYDARGAELFDAITELDEYYPTRTELALLDHCAPAIAEAVGPRAAVVEFGSGASIKVRLLLAALEHPAAYVPVDINPDWLEAARVSLGKDYPDLAIVPLLADYTVPFQLPPLPEGSRPLGFYPGSTIGNFEPSEARDFLALLSGDLGPEARLLVGVDLVKDPDVLKAAYDDAKGVTAAFNLNLLERINRELGADFDLEAFVHEVRYREHPPARIEMYLTSRREQTVTIGGRAFTFAAGEGIHTENSHKYTVAGFQALAAEAGLETLDHWVDERQWFSVHLLARTEATTAK